MLHKTKAIVLKLTDYSDTSVIAQMYTEEFGMQSYIVQGAKKPKAKIRINMLQPLQLVEMVVYHKAQGGLQRIRELRLDPAFLSIPYDVIKSSMAIFLNEVMYRSFKQQDVDPSLFQFVRQTIQWFDSVDSAPPNFHLFFMVKLSRFLGFYPAEKNQNQSYFDLKEGVFTQNAQNVFVLHPPHSLQLANLMQCKLEDIFELKISNQDRRFLLDKLVQYYQLHIDTLGDIHSHRILEDVLS